MPSFATVDPDRSGHSSSGTSNSHARTSLPTIDKPSLPGPLEVGGLLDGFAASPKENTLNGIGSGMHQLPNGHGDHPSSRDETSAGRGGPVIRSDPPRNRDSTGSKGRNGVGMVEARPSQAAQNGTASKQRSEVMTNGTSAPKSMSLASTTTSVQTNSPQPPTTPSPVTAPKVSSEDESLRIPGVVSGTQYRISSPPALPQMTSGSASTSNVSPSHNFPTKLQHRHTLEVPKLSTSSRPSRDSNHPSTSDDMATTSGRFSPNTPTRRRGSVSLARRATRSIHSDMHLDEIHQDEDAARWAEHIRQKRASKRRRKEEEDDDRVVVGTKVDQNHVNWVTAYNMLTGIRFTVSRTNAKMDRELTEADFGASHKFSFDITGNELTPSAKYDFKFKDYSPWVFRHLRSIFRLDPADYLMSLTSKYILSELGSPGKSGSFFYFSRDYKYIIKTIHHAEHKFLRRILREYYDHVKDNPNTLLSQFYGLHRVKIPYGRKIHFVVMNNLFPPHRDIHRTFDLKGSTIGRDFKEEELEKNPRATLKDLNWLRRNLHLEFGPTKKKAFIAQMERDVKLLQRLKIMDYSLLVGIHDLTRGNEDNLRDKTLKVFQPGGDNDDPAQGLMRTPSKLESERKAKELRQSLKIQKPIPMEQAADKMPDEMLAERKHFYFYSDDGGFQATHEDESSGDEIYYLGIIDCLTHYSLIKRGEHFFKGLTNTESQISAIPPERYGDRFVRFISGVTKTRERAELEKAAAASAIDGVIDDPRLSGVNMHRTPTDKVIEKAERQAERSIRKGANEDEVPTRTIGAARSSSTDRGELGATLPVVEEAAESASVGGRSARSTDQHHEQGVPPPTPPKDPPRHMFNGPPTPPKDQSRDRGRPPTPPKDNPAGLNVHDKPVAMRLPSGYRGGPMEKGGVEEADRRRMVGIS